MGQEGKRGRQESIQAHSRLDRCCAEGQEGARLERLRGNQEGLCIVQEGQGALHEVRPSHHSWVRVASRTALVVTHGVACFSALQKSIRAATRPSSGRSIRELVFRLATS